MSTIHVPSCILNISKGRRDCAQIDRANHRPITKRVMFDTPDKLGVFPSNLKDVRRYHGSGIAVAFIPPQGPKPRTKDRMESQWKHEPLRPLVRFSRV